MVGNDSLSCGPQLETDRAVSTGNQDPLVAEYTKGLKMPPKLRSKEAYDAWIVSEGGSLAKRKSHSRKMREDHVPRSPNSFIIFRMHLSLTYARIGVGQKGLSAAAGQAWKLLPKRWKVAYKNIAEVLKAEHQKNYPDWRYKPKCDRVKQRRQSCASDETGKDKRKLDSIISRVISSVRKAGKPALKSNQRELSELVSVKEEPESDCPSRFSSASLSDETPPLSPYMPSMSPEISSVWGENESLISYSSGLRAEQGVPKLFKFRDDSEYEKPNQSLCHWSALSLYYDDDAWEMIAGPDFR